MSLRCMGDAPAGCALPPALQRSERKRAHNHDVDPSVQAVVSTVMEPIVAHGQLHHLRRARIPHCKVGDPTLLGAGSRLSHRFLDFLEVSWACAWLRADSVVLVDAGIVRAVGATRKMLRGHFAPNKLRGFRARRKLAHGIDHCEDLLQRTLEPKACVNNHSIRLPDQAPVQEAGQSSLGGLCIGWPRGDVAQRRVAYRSTHRVAMIAHSTRARRRKVVSTHPRCILAHDALCHRLAEERHGHLKGDRVADHP
mmetsp:Transcript_28171/g.82789  ORF Transcript_28171/g.82789 Transcript_28171/m.82789 type:complete len:253 (+) Transcript_28171:244-1002(+)